MKRLPRTLKVLGGVVGIITALDLIVVAAWAAGAPTAVVIPMLLGLVLVAAAASQRRRWLPQLRRQLR